MAEDKPKSKKDEELVAISKIQKILDGFTVNAQHRILDYLNDRRSEQDLSVLELQEIE